MQPPCSTPAIDLWLPLAIDRVAGAPGCYHVNSKSLPGTRYLVDLVRETCECPDWTFRRVDKPLGSKDRWCVHILIARAMPPDEGAELVAVPAPGLIATPRWPAEAETRCLWCERAAVPGSAYCPGHRLAAECFG